MPQKPGPNAARPLIAGNGVEQEAHQVLKAAGLDTALHTLRNQPFGEFLLIIAALGLIIFGIYGLCEARWRRV